ncbi:MAG: cofactor-independent phosphoglycerate mutase [Oscillospiraceae bacterium]|jgi:2,3-bisphosphoglycerate-independent phosphoglycerate mutase|nr:cofactor-independent phosphoglycerate mutase [Oscillospiraceae bacterium]
MKYIVVLCDGMADYPIKELGGKTPLQAAETPVMDSLARHCLAGLADTSADGLKPGSDVANLAVLGYDVKECYTGRSPIEAVSMGIELGAKDISFRCNLVTLSGNSDDLDSKTMLSYCAGDISTPDAAILINYLQEKLGGEFAFYPGISYRHLTVWNTGTLDKDISLTPPHDIIDKCVKEYLPQNEKILKLMTQAHNLLSRHPLNANRQYPANSVWLWGEGTKPSMQSFKSRYGLNASMISAVDLLKGIGILLGMEVVQTPGATGYIDTNYEGKAKAAIEELERGQDFVYIHIEAPDECGHRGEIFNKRDALSAIDRRVLKPILDALEGEDFRILITADHATPLSLKTHTADPVPFIIYDSTKKELTGIPEFNEFICKGTGIFLKKGLTNILING